MACAFLLAGAAAFAPQLLAQDVLFCNATPCGFEISGRITNNLVTPCTGFSTGSFNSYVPPGCSYTLPVGANYTVRRMRVVDPGGAVTFVSFYNCGAPSVTVGAIECNGNPVTVNFVQADLVEITN